MSDMSICTFCGAPAARLCARCQSVGYCRREHQMRDWINHKAACELKTSPPKCALCKRTPATYLCKRCEVVPYCGEKHRNKDWAKHKKACNPYVVKISEERDRYYVVATRDIKEGDVIVDEEPLVFGPDYLTPVSCCIGCLNVIPFSTECKKCELPVCSPKCPGLKTPLFHGAECSFMVPAKSFIDITSSQLIVPLRLLLLQMNDRKKWGIIEDMSITAMRRMHKSLSKSTEVKLMFEENVIKPAIKDLLGYGMDFSSDTVKIIFSFLDAYGLEVKLPYTSYLVGAGKVASSMEHSCLPNTKRVFDLTPVDAKGIPFQCRIIIRAARDIKKGEHLTASIVRNLMCTWNRQQALMTSRGVYCNCERCMDPTELGTNFNTLKCRRCRADVLPLDLTGILESDWKCRGGCGEIYPPDYVPELFSEIMGKTATVQSQGSSTASLEQLLQDLHEVFHTNHYFCMKLKSRLVSSYGTTSLYEDVLNARMAELGLSVLGTAVNPGLIRMNVQELERRAELCEQVLSVIEHPRFESMDGTLDECLTQLSITKTEIAKRRKASGEWSAERAKEVFEEANAIMERAMDVKFRLNDPKKKSSK